ncbi:MAG TPA: tetratricopeptide repeat protein [Pirellula sp.]|nr:tetratricopeptide repeat protein [Pirellula sp.]
MATISEAFADAIEHHQRGRLQEAELAYRRILAVDPHREDVHYLLGTLANQVGKNDVAIQFLQRALELKSDYVVAHHNLGVAFKDLGQLEDAVPCFRRAIKLKPDFAEAHNNLGLALVDQGETEQAVECYRLALNWKPKFSEAMNNLGIALMNLGDLGEAVDCFRCVLEWQPGFAEAQNNLGIAFKGLGKIDDAILCYRLALEVQPNFAEANVNLGSALNDSGKLEEAVACYRRAIELRPDFYDAYFNYGNTLQAQGRLDEAVSRYRSAIELKPELFIAHNNLGAALQSQQKWTEAETCYRTALGLQPNYLDAALNLGAVLLEQKKFDEAIACYRSALELKPALTDGYFKLGGALGAQGKIIEAVACYRRALELEPKHLPAMAAQVRGLQDLCSWDELADLSQRLLNLVDEDVNQIDLPLPPFFLLSLPVPATSEQQFRCARTFAKSLLIGGKAMMPNFCIKRTSERNSKLTIGYFSADFRSHAVGLSIAEILEKHDRDQFTILGYSFGPDDGSETRRRLIKAFDCFEDITDASFEDAAEQIAADGVDILVDLMGYTQDARPQILARRPAPVQVNYLGYPGTMGADFIDYILVDDYVVPADHQAFYSEKLVHLPGCYLASDSQRQMAACVPSRVECKLPEDGFVFCSFNNSNKITPKIFEVWMELLKATPGSVLWLFEGNRYATANLRREAETRNVSSDRLVFAPYLSLPEHLARHQLADLFLDTFPYNAHSTASDALWAGCPVLTISGTTFASRVAGSLLQTLALPELITRTLEDYRAMALRIAREPKLLADIKSRLNANRKTSPVFGGARFIHNLEQSYIRMHAIYAAGENPRAFAMSS